MFTDFITGSLALSTPDHLHLTIASLGSFEARAPRRKAELQLLLSYNIGHRLRKGNFPEKIVSPRRARIPFGCHDIAYDRTILAQRDSDP
jgi:hypothetical protein